MPSIWSNAVSTLWEPRLKWRGLIVLECSVPSLGHLYPRNMLCGLMPFAGPCLPSASGCHCHVQNCAGEHCDASCTAVKSFPFSWSSLDITMLDYDGFFHYLLNHFCLAKQNFSVCWNFLLIIKAWSFCKTMTLDVWQIHGVRQSHVVEEMLWTLPLTDPWP